MPCYNIIVLQPSNNNIASHIIDGDNWDAITGLFHYLKCYSLNHNEEDFTAQEVDIIVSTTTEFLDNECYMKEGKTYETGTDNQIYSVKALRAMFPFFNECNGFTAKYISVNEQIVDCYD